VPKSTNLSGISFSEVVRIIFSGQGVFLEKKKAREEGHRVGKVNLMGKTHVRSLYKGKIIPSYF